MNEFRVMLTVRPPGFVEKLWYWSLSIPAPLGCSEPLKREARVRLLPQSWTRIHKRYANRHGLYWMPCILCLRPYGGHQSAGRVPDPEYGPGSGRSIDICPHCTRHGRHIPLPEDDP